MQYLEAVEEPVDSVVNLNAKPVSFEEFKAGKVPCIDHGRLAYPHGCNGAEARRNQKYLDEHFRERNLILLRLRAEYDHLVQEGVLREPTAYEHTLKIANGHPDNLATQAARRLLKKKYGVDFDKQTRNEV
jgi:hypothetical protein